MRFNSSITRAVSVLVGSGLIIRAIFIRGFLSYPLIDLVGAIGRYKKGDGLAMCIFTVMFLTHMSFGLLLISFGSESLKKMRKPLLITLVPLVMISIGWTAYVFFSIRHR